MAGSGPSSNDWGRFEHRADLYARRVLLDAAAGEPIVAGPLVRMACERHLRDRERAETGWDYRFDEDRANHVLAFFERVLRLPDVLDEDGQPAPFLVQPWQAFILGAMFGWVNTQGYRRFREAYIEVGKGNGKALALDTPIPTPTGWTEMGDIKAGDIVFDERGLPTRVVGAFDVMHGHECYRVGFDDGSSVVADAEHLWFTEQRRRGTGNSRQALKGVRLVDRGRWRKGIRTTAQIAGTLRYANGQYLSANHSIPLAGPLAVAPASLPIDPYVLGVWLGDGDSDCARITVDDGDVELLEHLAASGAVVGPRKQCAGRTPRYRIDGLNALLRQHGLLKNKHVPAAYLRGSIEQRLALLQGLMDTDGCISESSGQCEFTTTVQALAESVAELVVSLGAKTRPRQSVARLNGRDVGPMWRITFFPPLELPVFRLRRKAVRHMRRHHRRALSRDRRIVSCEPVESVPVRCIAVDAPSSLYLAGRGMVPTHNTPLCAGIGLYGLVMDNERAAEIYAAAADQDQAQILFRDAVRIVSASPDLEEIITLSGGEHIWKLDHKPSLSFFKTFSRESGAKSGTRPHMGLLDELHEHGSPQISIKVRAGAKGRKNAMFVEITNSGFDRTSICWQHHEHSRKIVERVVDDDQWFAFVCGLDEDDDPLKDRACWPKANPNLGVSVGPEYLERQVALATHIPAETNAVLQLNFCVWTQAAARAIDMQQWRGCQPLPSESVLVGKPCYGCLDLGETDDFTAWGRLWILDEGRVAVKFRYWIPQVAVERYQDRPYAEWKRLGLLTVTEGEVTDYDKVRGDMLEDIQRDGVISVFYDQRTARETAQILQGNGVDMVPMQQGFAMHEAIMRMLSMVADGDLCHGDDPILSWMASNVVLVTGRIDGRRRLAKEKSPEKIDGIAALVMGVDGAIVRRERTPPIDYRRQLFFVGGRR